MTAIGRWSARHPWPSIALWLAFVVACVGALAVTGSKSLQSGAAGESARAENMLRQHQARPGQDEFAYLHSDTLRTDQPAFNAAIAKVASSMEDALGGRVTTSVSAAGHSALVRADQPVLLDRRARSGRRLRAGRASQPCSTTSSGGGNNDLQRAERLSVPVTLLVLLIAFGAIVAALVPVLLAVTAVVAAFGLLGPISQIFPLDASVKTVVLLIGMAVGVDYALFYVIRSREERQPRPRLARGARAHRAHLRATPS